MRYLPAIIMAFGLGGCSTTPPPEPPTANPSLMAAEKLIDAFYSFDPAQLRAAMADAPDSQQALLFYQGWAEGGNYAILNRQPCQFVRSPEQLLGD